MKRVQLPVIAALICLLFTAQGHANTSISSIAQDIKSEHSQSLREQGAHNKDVDNKRLDLQNRIDALRASLVEEEAKRDAAQQELDDLAKVRDALQHTIATKLASKEELDNIFLDHARNFYGLTETSIYSAEVPERQEQLKKYIEGRVSLELDDINALFAFYFDDIAEGAKNRSYSANVLDRSGAEKEVDITRLGHIVGFFADAGNEGFLIKSVGSSRLIMSGEPDYFTGRKLSAFLDGDSQIAPVDLSGGSAISKLSRVETLGDRLKSGGLLVIPIILVGLVGIALVIERLIFLSRVRTNTDVLMTGVTNQVLEGRFDEAFAVTKSHETRPVGKVLMAGLTHREEGEEVLANAISEAILAQAPRLERFVSSIKVLAAVAPLLGLLGTVTGMINTFQVITTHGTGDPRLMAGGISEAMVTTQVGLAVAIPLLMAASFLASRIRNIERDMEEKGLGLLGALLRHQKARVSK